MSVARPWFTPRMNRTVADVLRDALEDAERRAVRSPTLDRLSNGDLQLLAAETLAFLRSRPSTASPIPNWRQVKSFDAGVNPWWKEQIGSSPSGDAAARLRKLRAQIYDYLEDELRLVSKGPGQNAAIHLAPAGEVLSSEDASGVPRKISIGPNGAGFGDAETNRIVEAAAMRRVVEHFGEWDYEDVSVLKIGWDITFTRGEEQRHVDVKGLSGRGPSVLLTRNEVEKAVSDPLWSLVVVTQALVAPVVHDVDREAVARAALPYVYRADLDRL